MSDEFILETRGLTKEFAGFVAVQDVNLKVRRGHIHALIGPNGAGKTTCFNLLSKFLQPSRGEILYNGSDITSLKPPFKAVSLTSSGISALEDTAVVIGTFLDEKVPLGGGFTSTLRDVVRDFNFGVVQVLPTGAGAQIAPALAHEGNAWAAGANLKDLL